MELSTIFFVLILFGLGSLAIEKIWGFNPYKFWITLGVVTTFFSFLYVAWPVMNPPYDAVLATERLTGWLVKFLPLALIGEAAGVFLSKITGGRT